MPRFQPRSSRARTNFREALSLWYELTHAGYTADARTQLNATRCAYSPGVTRRAKLTRVELALALVAIMPTLLYKNKRVILPSYAFVLYTCIVNRFMAKSRAALLPVNTVDIFEECEGEAIVPRNGD